ncbi:MAG: hypothetical protein OEV07_06370, partial [Gammaproteobacteria bacterium]|nr:hypothetical protein [Gammaproteobacteria bacterium]
MSDQTDIPILTDLIEKGIEIKLSDLGLDDELDTGVAAPFNENVEIELAAPETESVDPFQDNPELEQIVRRIFDEHVERAWQEIKLAI